MRQHFRILLAQLSVLIGHEGHEIVVAAALSRLLHFAVFASSRGVHVSPFVRDGLAEVADVALEQFPVATDEFVVAVQLPLWAFLADFHLNLNIIIDFLI